MKTKEKVEQGKGTAEHMMPLGYLLLMHYGRTDKASYRDVWTPMVLPH